MSDSPYYDENIRPFGRPSKYRKEYCQQIIDFFDVEVVERVEDDPSGRGGVNTHFEVTRVPSLYGFAARLGVNVDTLYEWAQATYPEEHKKAGELKHPDFSDALTRAQAIQDSIVFEHGMAGRLDGRLTGLYFTNKLGFKNKVENDVNLRTEQPILGGTVPLNPDGIPDDDEPTEDTEA